MIMPLIYFLLGVIFICYLCPILDSLVSWFQMAIEHRKMRITLKNVEIEKHMDEITNTEPPPSETHAIGFVIDDPVEQEEEEEEDD